MERTTWSSTAATGQRIWPGTTPAISISGSSSSAGLGLAYEGFFAGDVAEVLVYNRVLSDAELQSLDQYLRNRYNLP